MVSDELPVALVTGGSAGRCQLVAFHTRSKFGVGGFEGAGAGTAEGDRPFCSCAFLADGNANGSRGVESEVADRDRFASDGLEDRTSDTLGGQVDRGESAGGRPPNSHVT